MSSVEKSSVRFGANSLDEPDDAWAAGAQHRLGHRYPAPYRLGSLVNLNYLSSPREKFAVRVVWADHDQDIAAMNGVISGFRTDQAEAANHLWIIKGEKIQGAKGMNDRRVELFSQRRNFFPGRMRAVSDK